MPVYEEEPIVERRVVRERGDSMTGYALVKYGFMLAITIVVLYFIARVLLPAIGI